MYRADVSRGAVDEGVLSWGILPLTYIVAALVDMAAASVVLAALMMWFGVSLTSTAIWALPAIAILTGLLVGLGLLASALQVRYRDVGLAMPVLVQVWLFASSGPIHSSP